MNLTPKEDPDYVQLERALSNHQRGLTKIDDRIWVEEHNEMLKDLQQRIKGLPSVRPQSLFMDCICICINTHIASTPLFICSSFH
jgi:hypothetical protein